MKINTQIKKNAIFRKGRAFLLQFPRTIKRVTSNLENYESNPPILVNSLPKSGTHLLMQVANALPNTVNYGSFIAQSPSITMKLRNQKNISQRITKIVPNEVVGAHLHCTSETLKDIQNLNILHLFIHRDPRDVIISEANYLANMNRWHKLHKTFSSLPNKQAQIRQSILGLNIPSYPKASIRFNAFIDWIKQDNTLTIQFEDLINPEKRESIILEIIKSFNEKSTVKCDIKTQLQKSLDAIDPSKSHTFHKGGVGHWKTEMDLENIELVKQEFPELNYE